MTYIEEITSALVRVLTHACDGPPDRFAGYAANADFWVAEVRHCLDVIDGYDARFGRMKQATKAHFRPGTLREGPAAALTTRTLKYYDRAAARRGVTDAARRFLKRCEKTETVPADVLVEYCRRLGIQLPL